MERTQRGYGALGILVVIVIMSMLGVLTWMYQINHKPSPQKDKVSRVIPPHISSPATDKAVNTTQQAYDAYVAAMVADGKQNKNKFGSPLAGLEAIKPYLSDDLYARFKEAEDHGGGDAVGCASGYLKYVVSLKANDGKTATLKATIQGAPGPDPSLTVLVDLATFKITSISCPVYG